MAVVSRVSEKGRALIEAWEGLRLHEYQDSAGRGTIGYGHKLTSAEMATGKLHIGHTLVAFMPGGITQQAADFLLTQDLHIPELAILKYVDVPLTQNQFDTLASFILNTGQSAFLNSSLLEYLNHGFLQRIPEQLRRWVFVTKRGEKVKDHGLENRREHEIDLWLSPEP